MSFRGWPRSGRPPTRSDAAGTDQAGYRVPRRSPSLVNRLRLLSLSQGTSVLARCAMHALSPITHADPLTPLCPLCCEIPVKAKTTRHRQGILAQPAEGATGWGRSAADAACRMAALGKDQLDLRMRGQALLAQRRVRRWSQVRLRSGSGMNRRKKSKRPKAATALRRGSSGVISSSGRA